jgi:hypothetical protein
MYHPSGKTAVLEEPIPQSGKSKAASKPDKRMEV